MRYLLFRLSLLALLTLSAAGCGRVHTIRYVRAVEFDPAAARGLPLDQVYVNNAVMKLKGGTILVKFENPKYSIDRSVSKISPKLDDTKDAWESLRFFFEREFMSALQDTKIFRDVQRSATALRSFQPDATLKVSITEWHEGSKWPRFILGILSFGYGWTRVQYEGVLTDNHTGKILFAFADAMVHPGGPSFFLPFKSLRGYDLNTELVYLGSRNVAKTLRIVIETPDEK